MNKRVIRILAPLLGLALLATACGGSDGADSAATPRAQYDGPILEDLDGREVTVAVENAYLPFNYIDAETGEAGGWDYAAIDEICARLNCVPVHKPFDWDPMIQAVADGQFDMAADGITITEERAKIVRFSDGYIAIDQRIMTSTSNSEITDAASLTASDCKVATVGGTTNEATALDLVGEDRVTLLEEFGFVVQSVISGDSCAAIIDETAGQGYIGENADKIQLVGDSLSADQLGFIFPLDSEIADAFNLAIADMKKDGTMARLGEEFFSGKFTITYDDIE